MFSYIKKHIFISSVLLTTIVIVAIIAGRIVTKETLTENTSNIKQVSLINAKTFREGSPTVSANGTVESYSQVNIKAQTSAPIANINIAIGDKVYAGEVIMELQNTDIKAQLSQAQASLAVALGQENAGNVSLDSAKRTAIDKIRDAYIKSYDAVISDTEPILFNNDSSGGQLLALSTDPSLNSQITSTYLELKSEFKKWQNIIDSLNSATSTPAIQKAIEYSQSNISKTELLLSDISKILNDQNDSVTSAYVSSLNSWKATISTARTSISNATQALSGAEASLLSSHISESSVTVAQVEAARAGVKNLQAQLDKTIIRSPISGKISALPLREGEYASPGTPLVTIVGNDSGLIIKVYVSSEDLPRIDVGSSVKIVRNNKSNNSTSTDGIVSNVSPSVDQITKKAEVVINVFNPENSGLIIGQSTAVSIVANNNVDITSYTKDIVYLLPIQNIKIIPGAAYVFTVDENSKIKRNDVILGSVKGEFVEVKKGLSDEMDIVTPVYELDEGQEVIVQ